MTYLGSIELTIKHEKDYSFIYSKGTRKNFTETYGIAEKIVEVMQESPNKKLLLDYRDAYYNTPISDAYNLIKVFEIKLTDYKTYSMAVVVNNQNAEFAELWASIGRKRGFNFMTFLDFQKAEEWIKAQ